MIASVWDGVGLALTGVVVGFLIAAPVGAVGLLCIQRALSDGRLAACAAGLGAAVADSCYGAVAALGASFVSDFLLAWRGELSIAGGSILVALGARSWRTPPPRLKEAANEAPGLAKDFGAALLITLVNPGTVLAFITAFASLGAVGMKNTPLDAAVLTGGVFIGSASWWLTLAALVSAMRRKFTERWLSRLHRLSSALLCLFGAGVLASLAI